MFVPDGLRFGADHDAVLDHFAPRDAQVVVLQIGPLDARYLCLCGGGRALSRAGHIELLRLVGRVQEDRIDRPSDATGSFVIDAEKPTQWTDEAGSHASE